MCFTINRTVKRPRNRYVYKVVRQSPRSKYLHSWWLTSFNYSPGLVTARGSIAEKDAYYSEAGIYAYLSKKEAVKNRHEGDIILRLQVDPADFLHQGSMWSCDTIVAYSKAIVLEKQTEVTWYD